MKINGVLTIRFLAVYIIALSFVPLIHQILLAQNTWSGYGTGAYSYQSDRYFVLFNDPYDGSSKPNIHINPAFAPNARVSLVEFSDWTSWVDGFNLFNDFNMTAKADGRVLDVTYTRPSTTLHKIMEVTRDSVVVKLESAKEFSAHIELWKWVMTSINGMSTSIAPKPSVIPLTTTINFTFQYPRLEAIGTGGIWLSRAPSQIEIWPYEVGFNKITVDFVNSEMAFKVQGSMSAVGRPGLSWDYGDLPFVFPVIAVTVVALYLLVDRYGIPYKNRTHRSRH